MNNPLDMMFSIGRTVTKDSTNSYVHLAFTHHLQHYKLISYPELIVKGKYIRVPDTTASTITINIHFTFFICFSLSILS